MAIRGTLDRNVHNHLEEGHYLSGQRRRLAHHDASDVVGLKVRIPLANPLENIGRGTPTGSSRRWANTKVEPNMASGVSTTTKAIAARIHLQLRKTPQGRRVQSGQAPGRNTLNMGTKTPDMQLLEACPEAMILISEGKPVAWNSMACRVLDWSSSEAGWIEFGMCNADCGSCKATRRGCLSPNTSGCFKAVQPKCVA